MKNNFGIILISLFLKLATAEVLYYQPEQVHIAYGANIFEIIVTWSTFNETPNSLVEYGIGGLVLQAEGTSTLFVDGGKGKHSQYIHKVVLKKLTPDSTYRKSGLIII